MSWQSARDLGDRWAERHLPADLKGRLVQFASYEDEETCRFFHPDWSMEFKRMVVSAAARGARKRGAKTTYKKVTVEDYNVWRTDEGAADSPESRREFLDTVETVIA